MGEIKGYLVKGTWRGEGGSCDVYAYWWTLFGPAGEVQWCDDRARATERGRLLFPTVNEADAARSKSSHLSDVGIFRVYADGREERLPDLEEALAEIERLRQENMDDRGMYDAQLANVAHERDEARAENARLNAELTKLGTLKSAEVAPVIERFMAAFGADMPQAPRGTTEPLRRGLILRKVVRGSVEISVVLGPSKLTPDAVDMLIGWVTDPGVAGIATVSFVQIERGIWRVAPKHDAAAARVNLAVPEQDRTGRILTAVDAVVLTEPLGPPLSPPIAQPWTEEAQRIVDTTPEDRT